CQQAYSYPRTF
nr:immunoglobulin light chain junction region [Macaca mulatta]MPN82352.1 immunoglobulin light chain junction region [Macaca mulatta]